MRRILVIMLVLAALTVATVVGAIMIRANGEQHPESALTNATNSVGSNMALPEPPRLPYAGNKHASSIAAREAGTGVEVVTEEEMSAVEALGNEPGTNRGLKPLAMAGNEYAMATLGENLLRCSPRGLERSQEHIARVQRYVDRLSARLAGSNGSLPAPATSVDRFISSIASAEDLIEITSGWIKNACSKSVIKDTRSGFDWLSRAADRGYNRARMSYIDETVDLFGNARQVARYPQQAIASRNQARIYLEQIRAECTRDALRVYAWWSVALYDFGVEERYATVATWLQATYGPIIDDAVGSWGSSQEEALQQLTTPVQKQRAEQQVKAWLDRCGNT